MPGVGLFSSGTAADAVDAAVRCVSLRCWWRRRGVCQETFEDTYLKRRSPVWHLARCGFGVGACGCGMACGSGDGLPVAVVWPCPWLCLWCPVTVTVAVAVCACGGARARVCVDVCGSLCSGAASVPALP